MKLVTRRRSRRFWTIAVEIPMSTAIIITLTAGELPPFKKYSVMSSPTQSYEASGDKERLRKEMLVTTLAVNQIRIKDYNHRVPRDNIRNVILNLEPKTIQSVTLVTGLESILDATLLHMGQQDQDLLSAKCTGMEPGEVLSSGIRG